MGKIEVGMLEDRVGTMKKVIEATRDADPDLFAFRLVAELEKVDVAKQRLADDQYEKQDRRRRLVEGIASGFQRSIIALVIGAVFFGAGVLIHTSNKVAEQTEMATRAAADAYYSRKLAAKDAEHAEKIAALEGTHAENTAALDKAIKQQASKTEACMADKLELRSSAEKIVKACSGL